MKEDNLFRDKLYNHTLPVREELWDAIEAQLPPKKEDRIFPVFWFTLFAATLLGGALMIGLFTHQDSTPAAPSPVDIKSSAALSNASEANASETLQEATNDVTDPSTIVPAKETASHNTPGTTASEVLETSSSSLQRNSTATDNSSSRKTTNPSQKKRTSPVVDLHPNQSSNTPTTDSKVAVSSTISSDAGMTVSALGPVGHRQGYTTDFLPLSDQSIAASPAGLESAAFHPDPNCYKFGSIGSDFAFSADGFAGYGFSPKSYDDTSGESSIYINARKATESNQYTWNIGARLNLQHRSGFTARIGFTYTQAGDIFDYTDSLATQSTTRIDSFFAADGTFLYAETSQVLILGTLIKKIHNTYRYLDLPLIIGYEMPMGRSTIMANVGPVFNLTSTHEGEILDPMLHPRSITEGEPGAIDVYKNSLGIGLYLGVGVLFPIADHISGLIEPSLLYRLHPVTVAGYPLQEHRHHVNLNVGLRYHFN